MTQRRTASFSLWWMLWGTVLCAQSLVTEVPAGSEAAKSGIRAGDVLTAWSRTADGGEIRSPFEVSYLEQELSGAGRPVILSGMRGAAAKTWTLQASPWGLVAGAILSGQTADVYREGIGLFSNQHFAEAAARWEQAAAHVTGPEAVWLTSIASDSYARARRWDDCDRTFAAALQKSANVFAATVQLERRWADSFYQRSAWDQARIHYDRALKEAVVLNADATQATVLYEIGRLYVDRRQPRDSEDYLRQSLKIRSRLAPESLPVAQVTNALGRAYLMSGDLKQADQYFQRAYQLHLKLAPETMLVASSLHNLGLVALEREDLDHAESYLRQSLEKSGKLMPNGGQWANTASSLANIARTRGNLSDAEKYLEKVLVIRRKLQPDSLFLASVLIGLGNLHQVRGNLVQAEGAFREALEISQRLAPASREVAGCLENLGGIAQMRDDWPLAMSYLTQAVDLWRKVAPGTTFWAKALTDRAMAAEHLGRSAEAEKDYKEALKAFEAQKSDLLSISGVFRALAELHEHRQQLELAALEYSRALDILEREIPGSLSTAEAAFRMAELARRQGQWLRAESLYRKCLAISGKLVPNTAQHAQPLHGLALVALHQGQTSAAGDLFARALEALEQQSPHIGGSEQVRANLRAGYQSYYRDFILLLVSQNRMAEAFHVLERSRARALLDMLAQRDFVVEDMPRDLDLARRGNSAEYDRAQSAIADLSPQKDAAAIAILQAKLLELAADRAHIIDKIRSSSPRSASLQYPHPLDLEQTRSALDPGTALASFIAGPDRTLLFVVQAIGTEPGISVFTIPTSERALRAKVKGFVDAIAKPTSSARLAVARDGRALYDLLLRPAESLLSRADRVLISPDGSLDTLPFAALRLGPGQFLIEWKPVHIALSATLYAELKAQRRVADSYRWAFAAFGDPIYNAAARSVPEKVAPIRVDLSSLRGQELRPLPSSRTEVEAIAALYPEGSEVFLGGDATEERAKALGKDVRYLHFAVHGLLDERFPLNSALALTIPSAPAETKENGLLQAWELYEGVRWDADLVVLAACQSALGQELAGEGLMGLTRAVHYAGARSVLASLWSVDDRRTEQLMVAFYRNLRSGKSKDEALRLAQLELARSRAGASPFYWAAFTLSGDWR